MTVMQPENSAEIKNQQLIMNHPMAMLIISPEGGRILAANNAAAQFYGWNVERFRGMNMCQINTLPPESLQAKLKLVLSNQRSSFDFQHRLADGRIRDVEVCIVPILWGKQNVLCSLVNDITERKQAEQILWRCAEIQNVLRIIAETAARSSSLAEIYQTAHTQTSRVLPANNFQILLMDEVNAQIVAPYVADELRIFPDKRAIGKYLPEYVMRKKQAVLVTDSEFESLRSAGEVDSRLSPFKEWVGVPMIDSHGISLGVVSLLTLANERSFQPEDLNFLAIVASQIAGAVDRKRTEAALQESEARFRQLVQHLPVPLSYASKATGEILFVNKQFEQVIGYTSADLSNVDDWWRMAFPDKVYRSNVINQFRTAIKQAEPHCSPRPVEVKIRCKNGSVRSFLVTGLTVDCYYLLTYVDITDLRRKERLLVASYERRKKNELLNQLLQSITPSARLVSNCARMLGAGAMSPFDCFLVVMKSYQGKSRDYWLERREVYQPLLDSISDVLAMDSCFAWESPDGLCIFTFDCQTQAGTKVEQFFKAQAIIRVIESHVPDLLVSAGIAERASNLKELSVHYQQAVVAVHSGRKIWPQQKIFHYLDIGLLQLLPFINDQQQLHDYVDRTLGNLLRQGQQKQKKLLVTLESILVSENLKETASQLSIHYKTLMFRKKKLEEILGVSFDNLASRMAVLGAVQLLKVLEEKSE